MGVESRLRAQRKQERRQRKAEMPSTITARGLSKALAFAVFSEFILTACGSNTNPPEQFSMVFPPHLREQFDQTITIIPQHLIENINLAQCPPDISISNAQLASAVIKFDPSTGEVTFSITPEQNVEGLVSVTAQLKAVGESGSCVVAGIATGSAEIDTKATNCTQTSFVQNTAQLVCDGPGTVTADGATTPITNGNANVPILNTDGKTTARVDDGYGNSSELDIAIGANCNVTGAINYQNNQYEVPLSCDNPATVTSDVNGSVTSVSGPNESVNVPVRGGDGEHTAITATRNNFTTQVDFVAPIVNQPPQVFAANIYIRDGKIILDDFTCQQTVLNAPCVVNGSQIPVGSTIDIAAAPAVLGPGGNSVNIAVSDLAGRSTTTSFTQPPYNPFDGVQAFFQGIQKQTLQITISTEGDETQSIIDIDLSGAQKPPFSEKNWLHKFLETQSGGEVDCQTQRVSQDKWSATCDLPYPGVLGQNGELGAFSMTMTESNGHTQSKPIDVYALNATVGVAEPLPRPVSPSAAEILVNAGGVLGILASIVGVGAMGGAAIGMAYERARNMNLHEALDILTKPATDPHFVHVKSSRVHSQIAGYEELIEQFINGGINSISAVLFKGKRAVEDVPSWSKEYIREIWRRKKEAIELNRTPRLLADQNEAGRVFNAGVLLSTLEKYAKRNKAEEQFNIQMQRLPQEKSRLRNAQIMADAERKRVLRNVWLQELDMYLGETVKKSENSEVIQISERTLYGRLPELVSHLLSLSDKSWVWSLINEKGARLGPQNKEILHINRESLVGILCLYLMKTNFRTYLRYKEIIKKELNIGREVGRERTIELIKQKYHFVN